MTECAFSLVLVPTAPAIGATATAAAIATAAIAEVAVAAAAATGAVMEATKEAIAATLAKGPTAMTEAKLPPVVKALAAAAVAASRSRATTVAAAAAAVQRDHGHPGIPQSSFAPARRGACTC